jgi:hypothetical protein
MEMTTAQFAAKLGVTPGRVRALVKAGRIKVRYLTPRMMVIDQRELAGVKNRRPGRSWPKKKGS